MSPRRRAAALGILAVAIAVAIVLWTTRAPAPRAEPAFERVAPVEPSATARTAPALATAPRPPAAPGAPGSTTGAESPGDAPAPAADEAPDDPALPAERVPLDVTLVDRLGVPIPRAHVRAVWGEWRTGARTADAEGRLTLRVPRGTRALEVIGVDPPDSRQFLLLHCHRLAGDERATRVVVRTGTEIEGRLVAAEGSPIAGAVLRTVPQGFGFAWARSGADGRFSLGVVEGEVVDVRFDGGVIEPSDSPPGGRLTRGPLRAIARGVRALPGLTPLVLVAEAVAPALDLRVRVTRPDGTPEVGARVALVGDGRPPSARTDADGRATLSGLPDWPCDVRVSPAPTAIAGRWRAPRVLRDVRPGGAPIDVTLEETVPLRGRVVDAKGAPVARAWCAALLGAEYVACFGTDEAGRFESNSNVPAGTRLQVTARYPMEKPTARGVLDDVVAGQGDLWIALEEVGPLEVPSPTTIRVGVGTR